MYAMWGNDVYSFAIEQIYVFVKLIETLETFVFYKLNDKFVVLMLTTTYF